MSGKTKHALNRIADALEGRALRLVPIIGRVSEQNSPVTPTPWMQRKPKGELIAMIQLTATQEVELSISITDKKGNPAPVDGVPTWSVDDPAILALTVSPDGLTAKASAVGGLGNAIVSITADADLGEGVKSLGGSELFTVTAGEASVVVISAGTPTEQP